MAHFARISNTFLWPHNNGTCSIKSTSKFLYHRQQVSWDKSVWNWIWVVHYPKKIQIFLWKAMRNRLSTKHFLMITRHHMDGQCPRCHTLETTIHILRDYPWAKEAWAQSLGLLPLAFFYVLLQKWL